MGLHVRLFVCPLNKCVGVLNQGSHSPFASTFQGGVVPRMDFGHCLACVRTPDLVHCLEMFARSKREIQGCPLETTLAGPRR